MFLYIDNLMYKVTLESVQEKYKRTITESLSQVFKDKLLENVVAETMENTIFNPVYESNAVLVDTKDGFRTVVLTDSGAKLSGQIFKVDNLYPKYVGPECAEIKACLNYSLDMIYDTNGVANPYFIKVANSFELIDMPNEEEDKKIEDIVNEYYTKKVSQRIIKNIQKEMVPKDMIFTVCINTAELKSIQTVNSKFEIQTKTISAERINEIIVEVMPKFKAVSNVAEETVNRLYNYIMYGIDEKARKLPNPTKLENGKFVFTIKENDLNFFFDYKLHRWISEKILISTEELVWEKDENDSEIATYKGLKVSLNNDCYGDNNVYDKSIPFIAGVRIVKSDKDFCNYIGSFPQYINGVMLPCEQSKNFKSYIRVEL